ncbi:hypothetical protein AB1N83_011681, partial [Pleurotus pulmonarius]
FILSARVRYKRT